MNGIQHGMVDGESLPSQKPDIDGIVANIVGQIAEFTEAVAKIQVAIDSIDGKTATALSAITTAQTTAAGVIEAKKIAAIRAVEAAKPKSSWLDELDRPPGWKPGDPR